MGPLRQMKNHHTTFNVEFGALHYEKDIKVLECLQRKAMRLMKGLENRPDEEQLRQMELFILKKKSLGGDLLTLYNSLKEGCSKVEVDLFFQITRDSNEEIDSSCTRGGLLGIRESVFTERVFNS